MDFVPDNTVNKLILLYVLDKMEIPLTENSILEICSSQNNWVNWMDCKDLLAQCYLLNLQEYECKIEKGILYQQP